MLSYVGTPTPGTHLWQVVFRACGGFCGCRWRKQSVCGKSLPGVGARCTAAATAATAVANAAVAAALLPLLQERGGITDHPGLQDWLFSLESAATFSAASYKRIKAIAAAAAIVAASCYCRCCRTAEEMMISLGCKIGYWQGNVNLLVDDIGALKPSMFIGVPRVFDRIYNRVIDQVRGVPLMA